MKILGEHTEVPISLVIVDIASELMLGELKAGRWKIRNYTIFKNSSRRGWSCKLLWSHCDTGHLHK